MSELRSASERSLGRARGAQLLRYVLERGSDEFTITVMALQDTPAPFADAFEDELGVFERDAAPREIVSEDMELGEVRSVRLWSFDEKSLARLLTFLDEGLFHSPAGPDGWLENLAVYRAGELVLGIISHHREGVLRLEPAEHARLAELGISSTSRPS